MLTPACFRNVAVTSALTATELADRLGLLVWEEMPSAYRFTHQSVDRLTREWTAVIERDLSHPCIDA